MPNLTSVTIASGIPTAGTGTVSTLDALMADGGQTTLGAKADAKSAATDATPISAMSALKQISASVQDALVRPAIGTQTSVALTAGDQTVLASNTSRKGFIIENDSTTTVDILLASGASSATARSFRMQAGDVYESAVYSGGVYNGIIKGISAAATGNLRVTEFA